MSQIFPGQLSVLVTGAAGFVGRHVVRRLLAQLPAVRIHATTRRDPSDPSLPETAAVTWHQADLSDADAVSRLLDATRPDIVLHLASHVAGARDVSLVRPTFEGNAASTVYLLTALQERRSAAGGSGIRRFVQVGSLEEPEPGDTASPSSPYAAAKAAASSYGRMFHHLYGFPITFARVFMVYGPGHQDDNKLVPYTLRSLLAGEAPTFGSGTRPVDWIYVEDVAEGLVRLGLGDSDLDGRRVDLGSGSLHTVREVIEEMFRLVTPGTPPVFGDRADRQDEQVRRADVEETGRLLGWRPSVGLHEGLRRTAEWFRTG